MRTLRLLSFLAGLAAAALLAAEAPPPVPVASANPPAANAAKTLPLSPRFKQVRERIDALFKLRNEAPPPPDARVNPFRPSGAGVPAPVVPVAPGEPAPVALPAEAPADMALLQQAVASLKITGVVARGSESHVQINAKLYKKSDVVQASVQGQVVYIRVRDITGRTATLALNDAEMTLKF